MAFALTDKRLRIVVGLGLAGILLLSLSGLFQGREDEAPPVSSESQTAATEVYRQVLEEKVTALIETIAGVGQARVMLTMHSGVEYVYITEENLDLDRSMTGSQTTAEKRSSQEKTLLVEDQNGRKKALLKTTLEPTVRGAVVVCDGGGDPAVVERVTEAVRAILGISANRICVTKGV